MLRNVVKHLQAMKSGGFQTPCASFSTMENLDPTVFVKQRKLYQEQLKSMRKVWSSEIEARNLALAQQRAAEREKIVLGKAIRLREKRKESLIRQAADKESKLKARQAYKEHLAHNVIVHNERVQRQQALNQELVAEYAAEKELWLTEENVDSKITLDLFDAPSTTGLRVNDSEHWRYATHTMSIERLMHMQNSESHMTGSTSLTELLDKKQQRNSARHLVVQEFLDPMIGTGADRARYKELMKKFQTKFQENNSFEEMDDELDLAEDEVREVETARNEFYGSDEVDTNEADYHWVSQEDYDPALHADYIQMEVPSGGDRVNSMQNLSDNVDDDEEYADPAAAKQEANKKAALQAGKGRMIKGRMARKQVITKKK